MRSFVRAPGVLLAPLGEGWAAYSALSGETHLLNDESVAIVESLDLVHARRAAAVYAAVGEQWEMDAAEIEQLVGGAWEQLIEAGLIREAAPAPPPQ